MTKQKLIELKDSGKSKTQLVIDGEITGLEDLYQYAVGADRDLTSLEEAFLEKWADQVGNMSMKDIESVRIDTEVNEIILVGMLELGVDKITIGDLSALIKEEPKYEVVKRDLFNYLKHFIPSGGQY